MALADHRLANPVIVEVPPETRTPKSDGVGAWLQITPLMTVLTLFLVVHVVKDLAADTEAWYFHSTPVWLIVMGLGTVIYFGELKKLKKQGVDTKALFSQLPPE